MKKSGFGWCHRVGPIIATCIGIRWPIARIIGRKRQVGSGNGLENLDAHLWALDVGVPGLTFLRGAESDRHWTFLPVLAGNAVFQCLRAMAARSVISCCFLSRKSNGLQPSVWKSMNSHLSASIKPRIRKWSKTIENPHWWIPSARLQALPFCHRFIVFCVPGESAVISTPSFALFQPRAPSLFAVLLFNPLRSGLVQITYISSILGHLMKFRTTSFYKRDASFSASHLSLSCPLFLHVQDLISRHPDADLNILERNTMQGSMAFRIMYAAHLLGLQPNGSRRNSLHTLSRLTPQWVLLEGNLNCSCTKKSGERNCRVLFCNPQMFVMSTGKNVRRQSGRSSKTLSKVCCSH